MKYLIVMLLALVLTTQTVMAEETKTTQEEFTDISWAEVSKVEKVKKIIGRITILRMLNVVPVEFWEEFGLGLDKETIDWEKVDGIDVDMVLSAHEEMTQAIEAVLNKKNSTLGGEEFLRILMIIKVVNVLDYHIKDGKLYDEKFEEILDVNLKDKIDTRIADLKNKVNLEGGISNPNDSKTESDMISDFANGLGGILGNNPTDIFDPNDPLGSLSDMINGNTGSGANWQDTAGIGHEGFAFLIGFAVVATIGIFGIGVKGCNDNVAESNAIANKAVDKWDGTVPKVVVNVNVNSGNTTTTNSGNTTTTNSGNTTTTNSENTTTTDDNDCSGDDSPDSGGAPDGMERSDDGSQTGGTTGTPTADDINNLNNNSTSGGGTTYKEAIGGITVAELAAVGDRIEVIKNQYGTLCTEANGDSCGSNGGDYNESALQNGDAVTNFGGKL